MKLFKHTFVITLFVLGGINTVQAQCGLPSNLQTSYANNVTSFSWSAVNGASSYVLEAKQFYDPWSQAAVVVTVGTNSYSITGITQSLAVDWRVKAVCSTGVSAYVSSSFTIPCPVPSSPLVTNITLNSATLNWSPAAGYKTLISDFALAYRPLGSNTWISLGRTSDSSLNVSNLQANTTYEWCVNQTCPYFNSVPLISTFTTAAACSSAGNNSAEWISYFKLRSINRTSGAELGGYVQTNSSTSLTAGSRNNAVIRVGNSGPFSKKTVTIYIDYNDDGIYSSGEVVYGPVTIKNTNDKNFRLSVSSTAPSGTHGMRVIMARKGTNINGCISGFNGETEDYYVNISGGSNKGPLAVTEAITAKEELFVYPNPANDLVNIQLSENVAVITIYDLTGKKVYQQQKPDREIHVSISSWPATQYFVLVTYKDGHVEKTRFTKQ